jgi:hypothetical protein
MDSSGSGSILNKITGAIKPESTSVAESHSGAEQDRHASHFGLGHDGLARIKQAASAPGVGAEQDRYGAHFGLDAQTVQRAKDAILSSGVGGAEQDRYQAKFGLGHDGLARVKALTEQKGVGAEQDRYEGHFAIDPAKLDKALDTAKETFSFSKK